ncbi:MAG: FeoA family protein [Flavobacteriaceae bacterium]
MIPLDELQLGEQAEIETIETDQLPLKLIEMGCLPGSSISLIQKAPFNDPIYIKIDEAHLAIRKETAKNIFVRLVS